MGELIDGRWHRTGIDSAIADGVLRRKPSLFRGRVTSDGGPADGGQGFPAQADSYHL